MTFHVRYTRGPQQLITTSDPPGIIVAFELLLRPATYYNLQCEGPSHDEPSELKSLLMRVVEVKGSWSFVLPTEHQYQTKVVTQLEGVHIRCNTEY